MKYNPRTTAPSTTDKHWIKTTKGGYNECILISGNSCLPNCVGYAWGRWYELLGNKPKLSRGNAENWYGYNDGYKRGSTPKLGAVICWRKGQAGNSNDGAGHVAIVEKINSDGSILLSESCYGGSRFKTRTVKKSNNYYLGSKYTFQGFIYSPIEWEVESTPTPTPSANLKYSKGDKIILNGYLYRDSAGNGKGAKKTNYKGTITIVSKGAKKPYHIDSLGWVAESDIKKQSNSITYTVKKGDNLTKIAAKYGTTVEKIAKDNNIKDKNKINVGQKLIIK